MNEIPTDEEAIITDPSVFCDEHMEKAEELSIHPINVITATLGVLLNNEHFFNIAYRIKNGYGKPEDMGWDDVPEGERPDVKHVNMAIEEVQPICCFIKEHEEHPYPEQEGHKFISLLANYAEEEGWGEEYA